MTVMALAPGASAGVSVGGTLYYLLADQLGSTSVTTNATGTKIAELRYDACPLPSAPGVIREGSVRYESAALASVT